MAERRSVRTGTVNVVVLAGVALIVLLMILLAAPQVMLHEATAIAVPETRFTEQHTEDKFTIALTADHRLALNDKPISKEELGLVLERKMAEDPYFLVVIRADKAALHEQVLDLLSMVKEAGAKRIAIATRRKKEEL